MKKLSFFLFVSFAPLWLNLVPFARAQTALPPGKDATVQAVADQVARAGVERTVRTLAAFPTRHTLSGEAGADKGRLYQAARSVRFRLALANVLMRGPGIGGSGAKIR